MAPSRQGIGGQAVVLETPALPSRFQVRPLGVDRGGFSDEMKDVRGSTMYLPAGVPHRFRIRGEVPARILAIVTPGGLFDLYRQVGLPAERREIPTDPDPAEFGRWGAGTPGFGLEVLGPPLPA